MTEEYNIFYKNVCVRHTSKETTLRSALRTLSSVCNLNQHLELGFSSSHPSWLHQIFPDIYTVSKKSSPFLFSQ